MSNYIEYNDKIAFHPGYYIKELIEESGLTQEDFAKRLATTPKNLSILIRGERSLSIDLAMKLSRMLGIKGKVAETDEFLKANIVPKTYKLDEPEEQPKEEGGEENEEKRGGERRERGERRGRGRPRGGRGGRRGGRRGGEEEAGQETKEAETPAE
jgi:plasmid maintenance system antidote protein VapI